MIKLKNTTTNQELQLDYENIYLIQKVDWGTVSANILTTKYYGQTGEKTGRSNIGTRIVSIDGSVLGGTEAAIKARKKALTRCINPAQDINIYVNGYKITGRPRTSVAYGITEAENNVYFCTFRIEFFCGNPLFELENIKNIIAAMWIPNFEFDLEIPEDEGIEFDIKVPNVIVNAVNDGDVDAAMQIEFIATGAVTNPYIVEVETQRYIKVNATMQTGDKIIVNTDISEKSIYLLSGGVYTSLYTFRDKKSSLDMMLAPGDNLFRIGADDGEEMLDVNIRCFEGFWECDWIA